MRDGVAVEVRDLTKVYESTGARANDAVSFTVHGGEVFGLLGANGAGKSTAVKQIVGLLAPSSGKIVVHGRPVLAHKRQSWLGRTVAYLPQGLPGLNELTVGEAVAWTGALRGSRSPDRVDELCAALGLAEVRDRQLRRLSGGQRRLVQIAMTLTGDLPVLILDEPTADIDPVLKRTIWALISERAAAGAAVILVTHDVAEAEHVLDNVAIIAEGRLLATGSPSELKASLAGRTRIEIVVGEDATVDVVKLSRALGRNVQMNGRRVSAWVPAVRAVAALERAIRVAGLRNLEDVHLVTPTLEDVYLDMRGDE